MNPVDVRKTEGSPVGGTAVCGMILVARRWRDPFTMSPDEAIMVSLDPHGQQQAHTKRVVCMCSVTTRSKRTMMQ